MTRYAKRTDANHAAIRAAFRKLLGSDNVVDTSKAGFGLGDLACAFGGLVVLVEIKTEKGRLTKAQEKCKLPQVLVRNLDDVEDVVKMLRRWHEAISRPTYCTDDYPYNGRDL